MEELNNQRKTPSLLGIRSKPAPPQDYLAELRQDIAEMLDFCRARGISVSEKTQLLVSAFYAPGKDEDASGDQLEEFLTLVQKLHGELLLDISPATPDSIVASRIRYNIPLMFIGIMGLAGFFMIVYRAIFPVAQVNGQSALLIASAAVLGSAFYSFWTAKDYLRDGTFSRQYSQVYLVRFFLGIVSGFIFGNSDFLGALTDSFASYSPLLLAIVGGFSAEAVAQILQRVADILVTSVKGSEKDQAKVKAEQQITSKVSDISMELQDVLANCDNHADLVREVNVVIKKMMKK